MALPIDTTIQYRTVDIPAGQNFTWSLSKTLDQLTADEIKSQEAFTGFNSFAVNQLAEGVLSNGAPVNNPNHACVWTTNGNSGAAGGVAESWQAVHWSTPANFPAGVYMRTLLVAAPDATAVNTSLTNTLNNIRVVVDVAAGSDTDLQHLIYNGRTVVCKYGSTFQYSEDRLVGLSHRIFPAVILIVNDTLFLWIYGGLKWDVWRTAAGADPIDQGYRSSTAYINYNNEGFHRLAFGWTLAKPVSDSVVTDITWDSQSQQTGEGHYDNVDFNGHTGRLKMVFGATNGAKVYSPEIMDNADKTITKMYLAFAGFKFVVDGVTYKPIVTSGIVTGYTDDMTVTSDWDSWTTAQGHNVPEGGGGGDVDDEDNTDPLSSVGAPFGTGLAHYYVSTVDGAALTQISEAMSSWNIDATKKDLYRNLISCKIVKPPTAVPATPGVFEIYGVKPQYNGADITINEVTGNPDISFGPYSIDRKFNDFRDRAPYSRAEIFLPYCGWCALPSHVIGRSVSVAYYSDIIAGTVKAVVYCGTNPVAEASGVMSVDIPFAAQNVGEKVAAANIGMLAYGRAAIQTAAGIGTAIASKGKSGWGNILSGGTAVTSAYNQLAQVENGNYTEICGKSGDGCALAGVDTIVIKITRPLYGGNTTAPYVPPGFAHTVGFVSMKQSKVNACTGLIVCDNVEVSGISGATDAERAEIKRVLETGLYVNSPPE